VPEAVVKEAITRNRSQLVWASPRHLSCHEQQGDAHKRCHRGVYCDHYRGEPCPERALCTRSQI